MSFEEKNLLLKNLDSSNKLALSSIKDIELLISRNIKTRQKWDGQENLRKAKIAARFCDQLKVCLLLNTDPLFPELLLQIEDPPFLLFCRGDTSILNKESISIVGTRNISPSGKKATLEFAASASRAGVQVISGLANGTDGYAHQGTVNTWFDNVEQNQPVEDLGRTIAVLPSAIDTILPASHRRLSQQILQSGGCLISEYGPGTDMATWHYVGRNRIIAGMSKATVVMEAPPGSGALITADFAVEYNREVVFHECCFEEQAQQISSATEKNLETGFAEGKVSKYKIENRPSKFLEAGAAVVKDYNDFCTYMKEAPGKRSNQYVQGELFN
ncbi:MAG: DNA-protecting protein DprA [Treponema sp.]|nr:DNA-protecting protein DprA [Treponema sp.]